MDQSNQLDELIEKYKLPLLAGVVGLVLLIGGIVSSGIIQKTFIKSTKSFQSSSSLISSNSQVIVSKVKVDVSGAVVSPGVYVLGKEDRVEDAIKAAGGLSEEANSDFISKGLNLAQKVSDGMKIYIPFKDEEVSSGILDGVSGGGVAEVAGTYVVNINNASLSELEKLPGVGPVTAQKIIDARPFSGIEDLLTKKAVSRSIYEKIKEKVSTY